MSQKGDNNNNDKTKDVNELKNLKLKKKINIPNVNQNNMNEDKKSDVDLENLLEKLKEQNLSLKKQSVRGISSVSNDIKLNFDNINYNDNANNIENNNKPINNENVSINNEISSNLNNTINRQNVANSIFTNRTTEKEKSLENHLLNFGGTNINNTNIEQNNNNDKASNGSKMKVISDLFDSSINSDMKKNIIDDLFSSNYEKDNGSVMKNQIGNDLVSVTNRYVKPENVIYENNEIDEKGKKEVEEKEFEFKEKNEEIEKSRDNNKEEKSVKLIDLSNKEDINYSFVPVEKSFQPIILDDIPLTIQNEEKNNNEQNDKKEDEKMSVHSDTKDNNNNNNKNQEESKFIKNSEIEKESSKSNDIKKEENPSVQKEFSKKSTIKLEDNNIILNSKGILDKKEEEKKEPVQSLKDENNFGFDFGNDESGGSNKNSMTHLPKKESMKTENEFEKNDPINNEEQKSESISIEINQEISEKPEERKKDITQETISKINNSVNTEEMISVAPSFSKDKNKKDKLTSPKNKSHFIFPKMIKKKAQLNNSKEESSIDNSLTNNENQKLLNLSELNKKNESPPKQKKTNKQNTFPICDQQKKHTNAFSCTIDPQMPLPEIFAKDNTSIVTDKKSNTKAQNLSIYDLTNFSYKEPSYKEYLCSSILISKDKMQFSSIEKRKIILSNSYFSSMLSTTNNLKQISSLPNMSIYFNSVIINYIEINENFDKIFNYINSSSKNEMYKNITNHPSYLAFSPLPISKFSSLLNNNFQFPQTKQKIEYIRPIVSQNGDSFYVALLVGLMESFINTKSKVKVYAMFLDALRVSEIETSFFSGVNFPEAIIIFNIIYDFIECSNFKEAYQVFISALDVNKDFNILMVSYIKYIVFMCLSDIEINKKMKNNKHPSTFYQRLVLNYNEPNNLIFELIPYIFDVVLNIFYYESEKSNEVSIKTYQNDIQSEDGTKKYTINLFFYNTGYHTLYDKEIISNKNVELKSSSISNYILYSNEKGLSCPKCKNSLFLQHILSDTLICSECLIAKITKVMQVRSSLLISDGFISRECKFYP